MTLNRRQSRGMTLIELMVAVSILAISAQVLPPLFTQRRAQVVALSQDERALQWLEYEADARLAKQAPDPAVVERLKQGLPDAMLVVEPPAADRTTALRVHWRSVAGDLRSVELKLAGVKP